MKKIGLILFVLLIFFLVFAYQTNNNPRFIISRLAKKGFFKSDNLIYQINLLGFFPVGRATFNAGIKEEYKGKEIYHLSATAKTTKIVSKIFSANIVLDSFVDGFDNNPVLFKQKMQVSGKPDLNREITYDQKNGIMTIAGVRRSILPNTLDPLSAIFNLKNMDFEKNRNFEMNINTNQRNYVLEGKVTSRQILVERKIYKTYIVGAQIQRRDKNPYHQSSITMILLKEKKNLPILIKIFSGGFLITAKLIDIY